MEDQGGDPRDSCLTILLPQTKPSQRKQKQSRTSAPKVRTGCITCKKRHIKCDEAKPYCSNCLRNRGYCEGYPEPGGNAASERRPISLDSRQLTRLAASPRTQMKLDLDALDFPNATGMLYFQEFVSLVKAPWATATSCDGLWGVTLPQLARTSNTLRSAAMAIGALSLWHSQSKDGSLSTVSMPEVPVTKSDVHYFHAVAHYCQSLKQQCQQASLQDAVILSVLLLFFESLRGNRKAALDHINHGLTFLLALITDEDAQHHIDSLAPNPRPLLAAVADVYYPLAKQARTVLRDRMNDGLPLPNLTEGLRSRNQTMESFIVLLSQLPRSSVSIDEIPATFDSLQEFEKYWHVVRRAQTAIMTIMMDAIQGLDAWALKDDFVIVDFYQEVLRNPRIGEFCKQSEQAMAALDTAFQPLFDKIILSHEPQSPLYLRAIYLRLQYLSVSIFENPPKFINDATIRARTYLFREYLSVASIARQAAMREVANNPARQLSLQCDISWNLLIVAFFCRDPLVREEAVGMLRDYPCQDGLFNTRALHALAMRNRTVERNNAIEGTPDDQWQRLWRRELVFEEGGTQIILRYLERDEETKMWKLVEETAEIKGTTEQVQWKRRPITGSEGLLMAKIYAATYENYNSSPLATEV
ncbi:C6 zinc finger domain protein [Colletotrichum truncatum]|uniref:C6 zinc finger domain protein n=1 Tax=Colletotrichum truncatum TaxID=5467 RepID=A0ACC3ZJY4_COLTU|nr:C6 zinc finger domain protein [Colletotrichum truncatum]KAF6799792.1 C6 zinc finger domain protein [Colletotrichum truncatum]